MADQKLTDLTALATPGLDALFYVVNDPSGTPVDRKVALSALAQIVGCPCQGRVTTESGVPVSSSDRIGQSTLYFTPYNGAVVALYTAGAWKLYTFTERSFALSGLTSGKNYDVFLYDNAGTLTLELSAAWTSDTVRADAITQQDGIDVKSGNASRRLVGTIRTTGTTTTEDSFAKRLVWNKYNRVPRSMSVFETAANWTYQTATWRQTNANAANQLAYVTGEAGTYITAQMMNQSNNTNASGVSHYLAIGVDSTTVPAVGSVTLSHATASSQTEVIVVAYTGVPGLGYHYLAGMEQSTATATTNWSASGTVSGQSVKLWGMFGLIWN
ncbi:MAG TPA: hypothetical protein VFO16_24145 [Pseudonocardiaceae bacterium]|nr:hypothetical protein [Pseudonocardiaceae bacterium]